jgi:hypothetical protein
MGWLEQLDALGMKTPKRYKQIKFVNKDNKTKTLQHGLVVQKIKGAQSIKLMRKKWLPSGDTLQKILNISNDKTLIDIKHLQKIFAKKPHLSVLDFQGVIAEDGQLYVIDPMDIIMSPINSGNAYELDTLQIFEQQILQHHKRFTDKTLNHITYIDKQLWESSDGNLFSNQHFGFRCHGQ